MITRDIASIVHAICEIDANANLGLKSKDSELDYSKYAREAKHNCLVLLTTALDVCKESLAMSESDFRAIRESIFKAKSINAAFDETFYDYDDTDDNC